MMAKIKISSSGRRATMRLAKLPVSYHSAIRHAFYDIGKDVTEDAKKSILKKPKHGRVYRIKRLNRINRHVASAPGEAPASFTGNLWKNLKFRVMGQQLWVADTADYAKFLELGTSKMRPRPYLITAIKKNRRNAAEHFDKYLRRELEAAKV